MKLIVQKSKNNLDIPVSVEGVATIYLHSSYDPIREGERIFSSLLNSHTNSAINIEEKGRPFLFVIGAGFLYHLEAVKNLPAQIIVLQDKETTLNLSRLTSSYDNYTVYDITNNEELNHLTKYLLEAASTAKKIGCHFFTLPGYEKYNSSYCAKVIEILKSKIVPIFQDLNTQKKYQKRWAYNFKQNILALEKEKNHYQVGYPNWSDKGVVICAAGPSLDLAISKIKKVERSKTIIFATDTALKALYENGINSDAAITIDCQHYSINHYRYIKSDKKVPIIFKDIFCSQKIDSYTDKVNLIFPPHKQFVEGFKNKIMDFPFYHTGGNVTYSAIWVALLCGATHITIYGADYATKVEEHQGNYYQPHCRLTAYHNKALAETIKTNSMENSCLARALNQSSILNLSHYKADMEKEFSVVKDGICYRLKVDKKKGRPTLFNIDIVLSILNEIELDNSLN